MNRNRLLIGIVLIALLALIFLLLGGSSDQVQDEEVAATKNVPAVSVSELNQDTEPIMVYGQVVSTRGVQIVPEINGVVSAINRSLGQTVSPGTVVVELRAGDQSQSILQAQASLANAEAQLASVRAGQPQDIANLEATLDIEQNNLRGARTTAVSEINSVKTLVGATLDITLDPFFEESRFRGIRTDFPANETSEERLEELAGQFLQLENDLEAFNQVAISASEQDFDAEFNLALELLDDAIEVVIGTSQVVNTVEVSSLVSQATIDGWKSTLASERQKLESKRASIESAENRIFAAEESVTIARNNLQKAENATLTTDVVVAQNNVASAQAQLRAAQNAYSRTQIQAPIFGTISSIEVRVGDLVGPSAPIFTIANDDALRIDTYVSADVIDSIAIGNTATIDGGYQARVTNIAPAIDRQSGKIKVELLLTNQDDRLVEGMGVGVQINRNSVGSGLLLPIESIFVRAGQTYVYVYEDGKAVEQMIETQSLFGKEIVVTGGLNPEQQVILRARGINDGDSVTVETQD